MARIPQFRYFESRRAYFTQFQAQQRLLARGPKDEPDGLRSFVGILIECRVFVVQAAQTSN